MGKRRLALLIGNATFQHQNTFSPLRTPVNDAKDFANILRKYGDFEILNTLINANAASIIAAIDDLFGVAERGDLVLLYYSGHGYRGRTGNYYLASKDSHADRMRSTSIPAFWIHNIIKGSRSRHKAIILDCCFSGAFIKGRKKAGTERLQLTELKGEAEAILASSSTIQYSFEEGGRNSLFTQYLIEGIETGAADFSGDGKITIEELFHYAEQNVRVQRPGQTPMKEISIREDSLVIAKNQHHRTELSSEKTPSLPPKALVIDLNFPNAVQAEQALYERQAELDRIERALLPANSRPVIVLGERRIGKTSLQNIARKRLTAGSDGKVVPLVLPSAAAIRSQNDYAKEILQSLCAHLGKPLQETGLIGAHGQFQLTAFGQFAAVVTRLTKTAPPALYVIFLDEFDDVLTKRSHDEADKILGFSDYLIENSDLPFSAFFTMTRLPASIKESYRSPILATGSELIELLPFSLQQMKKMVKGLLNNKIKLNNSAINSLFLASGGHPYFTKLLLDRLLKRHWQTQSPLFVTATMLEDAVADAIDDPRATLVLHDIYRNHFSAQEQKVTLILAHRQTSIAKAELKALGTPLLTAARRIERRGYLLRRNNYYEFRLNFMGCWLREWDAYEEEIEALNINTLHQHLDIEIEINPGNRQVLLKGQAIRFSPKEFKMLAILCQHSPQLVSREQLAKIVWPEAKGNVSDEMIDVNISRLRRKLKDSARNPRYIQTVIGQGFILHKAACVNTNGAIRRETL